MKFKIVLDKRNTREDNKYPLKMRIYEGHGSKERSLNIFLIENEWDPETQTVQNNCKGYKLYNSKILQEKADIEKVILFGEDRVNPVKPKQKHSIIDYGRTLSKEYEKTGKTGNSIIYNTAVEMLLRYTNKRGILFEDVTFSFLTSFQNDLLQREVGVNTIAVYLRTIRAIFNKAINEELTENYPFKKFKIKQQPTPSRTLTIQEFKQIIDYKCSGDREYNRDLFLLSFCLIGINFSDLFLLKKENIVNGRVTFSRGKTHKIYSIYLHETALKLLAKHNKETDFLLPVLSPKLKGMLLKKKMQQAIHVCNNYLKKIAKDLKINKEISTYYARYSWANIARSLGCSKDLIGEALGHEYGNKTTGIYLDAYDKEIIDAANEKVIAAVFSK